MHLVIGQQSNHDLALKTSSTLPCADICCCFFIADIVLSHKLSPVSVILILFLIYTTSLCWNDTTRHTMHVVYCVTVTESGSRKGKRVMTMMKTLLLMMQVLL